MKTAFIEIQEAKVRKANTLIQKSHFDLTEKEQKIILYLISKIQPADTSFQEYAFSIKEFCECAGIQYPAGYEYVKECLKHIADKSIWIPFEKNDSLIRWLEYVDIDKVNHTINVRFDNRLKPYLLELKKNYTEYKLIYPLYFKHKYSTRLYEWLKSVYYDESREYETIIQLEEIKKRMGAEIYKPYAHFKSRALIPALKEINQVSDLKVKCGEFRNGTQKKVIALSFQIEKKSTAETVKAEMLLRQSLSIYFGQYTMIEIDD